VPRSFRSSSIALPAAQRWDLDGWGLFPETLRGDLIVSFSTAENPNDVSDEETLPFTQVPTGLMKPIFTATVEATEEAIVNAMVGAETMTGANGYRLYGLPQSPP
jgi:D-aminopeptidase